MTPTYRRILAIETATRTQSIALLDGDEVLEHLQQRVRYNHGSSLISNLDALLKAQNLTVQDIDLFAIGRGPGSFTGLRVAMAASKALARATNKPIVGVSSLAAMAYPLAVANPRATICAVIDARREEVYAGLYGLDARGELEDLLEEHTTLAIDLYPELVSRSVAGPVLVAGNAIAAYPDLDIWKDDRITPLPRWQESPSAIAVALLGRARAQTIGPADLPGLEPNYIRPSDVELAWEARQRAKEAD